ncbi:Phospholipase D2 [Paramuricea clavata]|uniref:phospholipase D n=1 Tax=Paramuricea clavata TaxID=317549 RepID=A0A6S7JQR5_PARCT|nr:Phospholipase D2 [Paramuricea clavata]
MLYKVVLVSFIGAAATLAYYVWNVLKSSVSPYPFGSFAPIQNDCKVKWFVDGQEYMSAVADAIEAAKQEILITDWQMNPYIFMKRPDHGVASLKWRLDKMLIRKADEGARVYILLYWETELALDLGSNHTQSVLNNHRNIVVYRHPTWLTAIKHPSTIRWSHHEKLVIVDRSVAFVGGIDLCFGRWDTHNHELMDNYKIHPCAKQDHGNGNREADDRYSRWVGKDYKNTFFSNESTIDWERPYDDYDYVDRSEIPRMPWHDVACAFTGAAVSDVAKHFIQRYNALDLGWSELHNLPTELDVSEYILPDISSYTNTKVQVLRSVDDWSAGQPHEASIYNAYLHAIKNSKHYIYIENQFFISSQPGRLLNVENLIQLAIVDRIYRAYKENKDFHVMIVMPLKPEFGPEDWIQSFLNGLTGVSYWNYATLFSGENSLVHMLEERGMPCAYIKKYFSVYGLRTHGSLGEKLATEIIYVHSKLMIVDDRVTIIGSANINDRSMLGGRDSEVAVIIEDVEMIHGKMNDSQYQAGKFSHNLRCSLHKEHLGLSNTRNVRDPLKSSFVSGISSQAKKND